MKKYITATNTFYGDTIKLEKISRPLKIYENRHGEMYINYRGIRYFFYEFYKLDYPYMFTKNGDEQKIVGVHDSYYAPFYIQITDGYDNKVVLYERIQEQYTIA